MTNPPAEGQKEHDWIEDHRYHHHRAEVIDEPEYDVDFTPPSESASSSVCADRG